MFRLVSSLLFVLLVASGVQAEERLHRIIQFGTLNTIAGDFAMKPNDCRVAHNIDWGRNVGSITKRFGYDSVSFIAGQDSAIGLFGAYFSDGSQKLIFVTDSANVGSGNVYASERGKAHFTGRQSWSDTITTAVNDMLYVDTFYFSDTVVVEYQADGSATRTEVAYGLATAINDSVSLEGFISADLSPFDPFWFNIFEDVEFLGATIGTDTAQDVVASTTNINTRIAIHYPVIHGPSFAMYNDNVYVVNESGHGIVYDGTTTRTFPSTPPGGLRVTPLKGSGYLDGNVWYAYSWNTVAADTELVTVGYLSGPFPTSNHNVRIDGFSLRTKGGYFAGDKDTARVKIWRTTGDIAPLDNTDTLWFTGITLLIDSSDQATAFVIDSISDDSLRSSTTFVDAIPYGTWTQPNEDFPDGWIGRYSQGGGADTSQYAPGVPEFIEWDTVVGVTGMDSGLWEDVWAANWQYREVTGFSWVVVMADTNSNLMSDTGRSFNVMFNHSYDPLYEKMRFALPEATETGMAAKVYRTILQSNINVRSEVKGRVPLWIRPLPYYLLGVYSPGDTIWDSIPWDTMQTREQLQPSYVPPSLKSVFAHNDRLYGIQGSRLYVSRLDTPTFGPLSYITLGGDDGDEGTVGYPTRGVIRFLKNNSGYNIFQDANLLWNRREVSGYWGCIAPHSHAAGPLGHYYLSEYGVVCENEGQFLERTQMIELISAPLKNFTDLAITALDDAQGFYFDQKYMLCIGDTTYVYDERAKAWSTWSMTFAGATSYGTEDEIGFLPGDSMYFIRSGESNLYRYGTSELDNGVSFHVLWKSSPLLMESPTKKSINAIEIAFSSGDDDDTLQVYMYDESDALITGIGAASGSPNALIFDTLSNRYQEITVLPASRRYFSLYILNNAVSANSNAVIDLIDVYWTEGMKPERD